MTRRRSRIKSNTMQAQQNNPLCKKKQLADFAQKIVNDAKNNGIEKIHIRVGRIGVLSETVNRDKIIVSVPSSTQSRFLKNHINGLYSIENPLHIDCPTSKSEFKATVNNIKGAMGNEDDGTGKRRGRIPIVGVPDEIIEKGVMPKPGIDIIIKKGRESKKPFVGNVDGTGGRRGKIRGKTPPGIF